MEALNNVYTESDYVVVRAAIKRLPGLLAMIVERRFWKQESILDIAVEMGVSEKAVDHALETAFRLLRETCLRHPSFSRSLANEIRRMSFGAAA